MNLDLNDTQGLLQQTVRDFLERELPFDRIRELERDGAWDQPLWKEVCRQGWLGLPFREEFGGAAGGLVDAGVLLEEFARRAAILPMLETLVCGRVLQTRATPELGSEWIPRLLSGETVAVPALLEASDRFGDVNAEVREGRLRGEKSFIDYGQSATHHLVAARDAGELGLFLVDARVEQVKCEPLQHIGRTPQCSAAYADAPAQRVSGEDGYLELIALGRALSAVQCVGHMQQALDMTIEYAGIREQFGKRIGSFQAVRHHCANMLMRVSSARLLAFEALSGLDAGRVDPRQIAAAKAAASRAVPEVTMLAHQIHGGNGVIEENDLYFFTLRGKERSLAWGTAEECLAELAQAIDDPCEWL